MRITVVKIGEDSGNCREFFRNVENKRVYCTVDDKFHTFRIEPECPFRDDIEVIEVDKAGAFVKRWQ